MDLGALALACQQLLIVLATMRGVGPERAHGALRIDLVGELATIIGGGLQHVLLRVTVALRGPGDARGIDDLAGHRRIARATKMLIKAIEQRLDRLGPDQQLSEQPDRLGVRHSGMQLQAEKPYKRQPDADLELGLIVRQFG